MHRPATGTSSTLAMTVFPTSSRLPRAPLAAASLLLAIGWIAIARTEDWADLPARFVRLQVLWSCLAVLAAVTLALVRPSMVTRAAPYAYALVVILLAAVLLSPSIHGARRWLRIGWLGIQPSEFAKVAFVLACSRWLAYRDVAASLWPTFGVLVLAVVPMGLVLLEPDLGTALVFPPVALAMLYAAGMPRRSIARLVLLAVLAGPLLWTQMSREQKIARGRPVRPARTGRAGHERQLSASAGQASGCIGQRVGKLAPWQRR